jgi:hypothetical protein
MFLIVERRGHRIQRPCVLFADMLCTEAAPAM